MKIKSFFILILVFFTFACDRSGKAYSNPSQGFAPQYHQNLQLAEEILYDLLLPNSMARTVPRNDVLIKSLSSDFNKTVYFFKQELKSSHEFLARQIHDTPAEKQDPALAALAILFELKTPEAMAIIRQSQNHPNQVVSTTARQMITDNHGPLSGYKNRRP